MWQCRFNSCNKCTTQMGGVDNGQSLHIWGQEVFLLSLYIFTFAINLKIMLIIQSCSTHCIPWDCSPPGFSFHGILQVRILQWVAIPFSRGSSRPKDQSQVSCITGRFFNSLSNQRRPISLKRVQMSKQDTSGGRIHDLITKNKGKDRQ